MLTYLTGKNYNDWDLAMDEEEAKLPTDTTYENVAATPAKENSDKNDYFICVWPGGLSNCHEFETKENFIVFVSVVVLCVPRAPLFWNMKEAQRTQ